MLYNWDAAGIIASPEGSFKFPVSDMLMPTTVCVEERQKEIKLLQSVVYVINNRSLKFWNLTKPTRFFAVQNYSILKLKKHFLKGRIAQDHSC